MGIGHYYNDDAFYEITEVGLSETITASSLFKIASEEKTTEKTHVSAIW